MVSTGRNGHSASDYWAQISEACRRWLAGKPLMSDAEQLRFFSAVAASENPMAAAAAREEIRKLLARIDAGAKQ